MMATKNFWIGVAFILVFGLGGLLCFAAATKADNDGNKRKSGFLTAAATAWVILGLAIMAYFDIHW
jgi:cell division protein FtsW (lipid II flippase)